MRVTVDWLTRAAQHVRTLGKLPDDFDKWEPQRQAEHVAYRLIDAKIRADAGDLQAILFRDTHRRIWSRLFPLVSQSDIAAVKIPAREQGDSRVRVAIIEGAMLPGGIQTWIETLASSLDRERIDLLGIGVTGIVTPHLRKRLESSGTRVFVGHEVRALAAAGDVALLNCLPNFVEYVAPEEIGGPKVVYSIHATAVSEYARAMIPTTGKVHRWIAVSEYAAECLLRVHQKQVDAIIYNGIDPSRVKPLRSREEVRDELGVTDIAKILLFVGRLSPEKVPGAVAQAIAGLTAAGHRKWVGVLVGPGDIHYWQEHANRAMGSVGGYGNAVKFVGEQDDIGSYIAAADVGIMPSEQEACSLSLLEFWLGGLPTVATPVGMARKHGNCVWQIDRDWTGPELRDKIIAIDQDRETREYRVELARMIADGHYTDKQFGAAWTDEIVKTALDTA